MAEAIGLGSGIIAFLTVSVQLSTVLFSVWDDFKEAPKEIQNIEHRIKELTFYLQRVHKEEQALKAAGSTCQSTSDLEKIWTSLYTQLREVTTDFEVFGESLKKENVSWGELRVKAERVKKRAEWVIKNKKRALEFDRKITGHLETFKTIWGLVTHENVKELGVLQSQHFNGMSQTLATQSEMIKDLNSSQTALHTKSHVYLQTIETLTQKSTTTIENTIASAVAASQGVLSSKLESLDRRLESSDFVTKQFLAIELDRAQRQLTQELIQELTQVIHSVAPNTSEPVYTTVSTTQNIVRKSVSVCFNNWNYYRLPIGQFQVSTRSKRIQYDTGTEGTNERSFGVQFEFFPAPWLSNKSIVASFQRYYDRSRTPRFGTNMYFPITVSKDHPPFRAMEKDDIALLQHLLGSGLARPNDRDKDGWTLLHKAARWRQPEICSLLINEGADLEATDIWGRTPLHLACQYGVSETVRLLIKHATDLSDSVISSAMRSYATVPSIFNLAINSMFFRLFEDFAGFEGMEPTVIAKILCFQLSGTFKVQPKALRSWLLSRRPKHLDSAMPTQSLISYELQTMFKTFDKARMEAMVTAVRHSCAVKSSDLFLLLSSCGVINSLSDDEVFFSLGIASENGNLIPLKILLPITTSLQKKPGYSTGGTIRYRGHPEIVKSILDKRAFDKSKSTLSLVSTKSNGGSPKRSGYHTTPLMFAAISGDINVLKCLIETGVDVQALDWRGRTALDHAIASNNDNSAAAIELLQEAQRRSELKRLLCLDAGHESSQNSPKGRRRIDTIHAENAPTLQARFTKTWISVIQIYTDFLGVSWLAFSASRQGISDWWKYLRQTTRWDILLFVSGLVFVTGGFIGFVAPQVKDFILQHRQWFMYFVLAYSMYLVGKSRSEVHVEIVWDG